MFEFYTLHGHNPVLCTDTAAWTDWYSKSSHERQVGLERVGSYVVSTSFLGVNEAAPNDHVPRLFQTLVFSAKDAQAENFKLYYSTWEEAEAGHALTKARMATRQARLDTAGSHSE
jgi:hypothetical protein